MKRLPPAFLLLLAALPLFASQAPAPKPSPKPTPAPPPVIEGTVKGPDGKPVEGALVAARSTMDMEPALSTVTDAAGKFRLTVRRAVPYVVRVEARGLAGSTVEKARPGTPVDVVLTKGATLEGTVRDGTSGQPVAQVRVLARSESAITLPWDATGGVAEAVTDAKGRFRLEGLGTGAHTVWARVKGAGSARKTGALPGRPADLYLFPGATVSGTVWGPGDARVAGAVVRADADGPGFRSGAPPVVSDAHGNYEILGLEPGSYRVSAHHKDFAPGLIGGLLVERGADVAVDIPLEKGSRVAGRLVSGPEQTAAGTVAIQEMDGQPAPQALRETLRAEAAANGRFRLDVLPSGAHVLAVTAPGYASKRVEISVPPGGRDVDVGDVELETGLTIRGRVRDSSSHPVAGANVAGYPTGRMGTGMGMSGVQAVSEADGAFVLAGLQPGSYRLSAAAPGYAMAERPVDAGAEKVELVLAPAGSISGTVVDDAGRPVEAFRVNASPARRESMGMGTMMIGPRGKFGTGTAGRFLLEDLVEGTYVVEANAANLSSANVADVKVSAGATTDVGTIKLSAGGTVRGTVSDGAGAPVPGATLFARGAGMDFSFGQGAQSMSDPAGVFELTGVPTGTVEIVATHPNYAEGRVSGVEVDPAKGPAEARIVLSQGGRIEGWVRRRDGAGIGGVNVNVMAQRPGGRMGASGPGMLTTSPEGGFVSEHVPVGRVSVMLMVRSGQTFTSAQSTEVDVREGETTPVELRSRDILVSGHVTRAGAPLAGVRITLRGERMMMMAFGGMGADVAPAPAGPQRMTAVTGDDGGYELIADQPGRAFAVVERLDGKVSYPGRSVDLPDADAYTLDMAFAGASLAGIVIDRETEQPVPRARVSAWPKKPDAGRLGGSGAETGEDGRFQFDVEPGDYGVSASAENYGRSESEVSVTSGGASDVRLALARGLSIDGKVVDARGIGVGGLMVFAAALGSDGRFRIGGGGAMTLPDGTFQIAGLQSVPHNLLARSEIVGLFARRDGVRPGDKNVVLTLRPGGRVTVRVLGVDGQPVAGAMAYLQDVIGVSTDAQGIAELFVPAGNVDIRARKDRFEGKTTVAVAEGGTAAVEIKLGPPGASTP